VNGWAVKDPWIFFGVAGAVVAYVLYMMIRRRKGERPGALQRDHDL
jgi:hypothetical protein